MREVDQTLEFIEELLEIESRLEKLSIASSCTYVGSLSTSSYDTDVAFTLHEKLIGESYVPTPMSSDLEDSDWEEG